MTPAEQGYAASPGANTGEQGESLIDLIRQLTRQGAHLAEQQLALVQAEVRSSANDVKTAVGGMLGAAVVGIAGLGVLLMGLAYLLGDAIDNPGLGTLIVGVVTLIVAYLLYSAARKKIDAAQLTPDRSIRTLERTPEIVRGDH
jgi:hypothetical protein